LLPASVATIRMIGIFDVYVTVERAQGMQGAGA